MVGEKGVVMKGYFEPGNICKSSHKILSVLTKFSNLVQHIVISQETQTTFRNPE